MTESFLPQTNGVSNSVRHVVDQLVAGGHDVLVIAPGAGPGTHDADGVAVPVVRVRSVALPGYATFPLGLPDAALEREMARFAPDVVHLASPISLGALGQRAARKLGIPTVAVYQTDVVGFSKAYPVHADAVLARWVGRIHRRADRTLVPSRSSWEQLAGIGVEDLHLWRRGVSLDLFDPTRRSEELRRRWAPAGEVLVGYVGRLAAEKKVHRLVELAEIPGVRLVVIGDGPARAELEHQLPEAVFTGMLAGQELATAFASLDVFCHTGEAETFCQTIQEAQASGVAVVAPAVGGPLDLVEPSVTGLLHDPARPASFREQVSALVERPGLRQRLADCGREAVAGRSWATVVEELVAHYRAVIEREVVPVTPPDDRTRRISVVGCGYLGAVHAAGLAELGFEVLGVETRPDRLELLRAGEAPFHEPGLGELLAAHVGSGRLRFTDSVAEAAEFADVHFVCVGTPQAAGSTGADVSAVDAVVQELAAHAERDALVIGKSTVPVGTTRRLNDIVRQAAHPGVDVELAWNPEFLREGHAVEDTLRPDRLVFGVDGPGAELALGRIYTTAIAAGTPVHVTDPATAELAKTAANAFLATKISFINSLADLSERAGADVTALADVLGDDARIGRRFLDAGIGFGGGCLPKDVRALAHRAEELGAGATARLLGEVDAINAQTRARTVRHAVDLCDGELAGRRLAVLGAAFKPGSDDVRDSPALAIASRLHDLGAEVVVHDPQALLNALAEMPQLRFVTSVEYALLGADLVLHLTEWPEYGRLDPVETARLVRRPRLIDGRNRIDVARWRAAGWTVHALGRGVPPRTDARVRS